MTLNTYAHHADWPMYQDPNFLSMWRCQLERVYGSFLQTVRISYSFVGYKLIMAQLQKERIELPHM